MDAETIGSLIGPLLLIFAGTALYFVPTFIARANRKSNTTAIVALNIVAGWTIIGWVVALVWSLMVEPGAPGIPAAVTASGGVHCETAEEAEQRRRGISGGPLTY